MSAKSAIGLIWGLKMTKDEALKLALSALDEVRQETFRLMRNGETLYAEKKVWEAIYTIKKVLAQPEQEPVAWISTGPARMIHWTADKPAYGDDWVPLYTTPPQRKPLTDEEIWKFWWARPEVPEGEDDSMEAEFVAAVRAVLAAHGINEKNNG